MYIGVDLGGTHIRCGVVDKDANVLEVIKERSEVDKGYEYVIEKMIRMIKSLKNYQIAEHIGIGCPGPLNAKAGLILSPTNFPDWDRVPLQQIIAEATGKAVMIDNDANVAALAEALFGAGKDEAIVQYITISTGVGGGLVINKNIIVGANSSTGEIANIIIKPDGYKHSMLNGGSFESQASGTALPRIAAEKGLLLENAKDIFEAYQAKDPLAIEIMEEYIDNIARGMQAIGQTIDPHIFIIGGGVMQQSETLLPLIRAKYKTYVYDIMADTKIVAATLEEPGVVGAAFLHTSNSVY